MVKADKLSVIVLPQRRLYELILLIVPFLEVVVHKSACIGGILVKAPESVVDMLVDHIVAKFLKPMAVFTGLVVFFIDPATPFAHEERRYLFFHKISPCVVPVVVKERLTCESFAVIVKIEPRLIIYLRAVIMRRVNELTLMFAKINGILPYAAEVSSPPRDVVRTSGVIRIIDRRRRPVLALLKLRVDLDTLDHDKQVRVLVKAGFRSEFCGIAPVILIGRAVPLGKCTVIFLSVRLVLEVDSDYRIVVLVVVREPRKSLKPVVRAVIAVVPQRIVVTCGICGRAVDIHHDLDTILAAPRYDLIPYVKAVHRSTALNALDSQFRVFVLIELYQRIRLVILPLEQYLR